jgi:hypothetical protein
VDDLSACLDETATIAMTGELVARIGGVARKGAAELPIATVRRDC